MTSQKPWWVETAVEQVEKFLLDSPRTRVFEWGAGCSTVWLAKRCEWLLSVEHDDHYADKVMERLVGYQHANLLVIPFLGPAYPGAIADFAADSFDLICVDGRMRNACVQAAIPQLRRGGMLLLDNSDRDRYAPSFELLKDWHREDFSNSEWQTSLFCDDPALQEILGRVE